MKRGEIWTVAGGAEYARKPRPSVILQCNDFSDTESITLCPLTTDHEDKHGIRISVVPDNLNGLSLPSRVMVDKISTVSRSKLGRRIGCLGEVEMSLLDAGVRSFLGLFSEREVIERAMERRGRV